MHGRNEATYHYDLTNVVPDVFDWRCWIAGRLKANSVVVGPGISRVILAFFNEYDHNWKQARLDYLIVRTDGHSHRVHPRSNGVEDHVLQLTAVGWRQLSDAPGPGEAHVLLDTTHGRPTLGQAVAKFELAACGKEFEPPCFPNGMLSLDVKMAGGSGAPGPAVQSGAAQAHRPAPRLEPVPPEQSQSPPPPPPVTQQRAQSSVPHVQKPAPPSPPELLQAPTSNPMIAVFQAQEAERQRQILELQQQVTKLQELLAQQVSLSEFADTLRPPGSAQGPVGDSQQPIQPVGGATGRVETSQQSTVSAPESMHPRSGAPEPAGDWRSVDGPRRASGWQQSPQPEQQPDDAQGADASTEEWPPWQTSSMRWGGSGWGE